MKKVVGTQYIYVDNPINKELLESLEWFVSLFGKVSKGTITYNQVQKAKEAIKKAKDELS